MQFLTEIVLNIIAWYLLRSFVRNYYFTRPLSPSWLRRFVMKQHLVRLESFVPWRHRPSNGKSSASRKRAGDDGATHCQDIAYHIIMSVKLTKLVC